MTTLAQRGGSSIQSHPSTPCPVFGFLKSRVSG